VFRRAPLSEAPSYRRFWDATGATFPDLGGAVSTRFYLENEKRLLTGALRTLEGCALLKTDLWDECKNSRILQWVAAQGALAYGVDISLPTVRQAGAEFAAQELRGAVGDVRRLPFRAESFDAVYSMGTIEHFADPGSAVAEIHRVLRRGGRAVVGVPNRLDPFLRPALVAVLRRLGLYAYGYERSFTRRGLRRMMERSGFRVIEETGILFLPGWLRMAELYLRQSCPRLARGAGALVRPFAWLDGRLRCLRRHGYLIACVGEKDG
jgi:SAM-dependent methyltransferase